MKVITPEELLGVPSPKIMWHYGTCDICRERLVDVCHFNYDKQPDRDFRMCKKCFKENKWEILRGLE